jgi:hypothetical protein
VRVLDAVACLSTVARASATGGQCSGPAVRGCGSAPEVGADFTYLWTAEEWLLGLAVYADGR